MWPSKMDKARRALSRMFAPRSSQVATFGTGAEDRTCTPDASLQSSAPTRERCPNHIHAVDPRRGSGESNPAFSVVIRGDDGQVHTAGQRGKDEESLQNNRPAIHSPLPGQACNIAEAQGLVPSGQPRKKAHEPLQSPAQGAVWTDRGQSTVVDMTAAADPQSSGSCKHPPQSLLLAAEGVGAGRGTRKSVMEMAFRMSPGTKMAVRALGSSRAVEQEMIRQDELMLSGGWVIHPYSPFRW